MKTNTISSATVIMPSMAPKGHVCLLDVIFTPTFCAQVILLWSLINFEPPTYGTVQYPVWGLVLGWCMVVFIILWIPVIAVYKLLRATGSPWKVHVPFIMKWFLCNSQILVSLNWASTNNCVANVATLPTAFEDLVFSIREMASIPGYSSRRTLLTRTLSQKSSVHKQRANVNSIQSVTPSIALQSNPLPQMLFLFILKTNRPRLQRVTKVHPISFWGQVDPACINMCWHWFWKCFEFSSFKVWSCYIPIIWEDLLLFLSFPVVWNVLYVTGIITVWLLIQGSVAHPFFTSHMVTCGHSACSHLRLVFGARDSGLVRPR